MAAAFPPWVMFEHSCTHEVQGCSSSIADTRTRATCFTTAGIPITVSLCLAAPPEGSRVCVQLPDGVKVNYSIVLAAHRDSVVVQIAGIEGRRGSGTTDHFVYNAGNAAADSPRPPSLSLLPPYGLTEEGGGGRRYLYNEATGLLRRGGDHEFVVAELDMVDASDEDDGPVGQQTPKVAELRLLRSTGRGGGWSVMRPPVSHYNGGKLPSSWCRSAVIPFGDRLCWVDLYRGLMFADVFDESLRLQYVPLPEDPVFGRRSYRNVCATGGGEAIKFVNIFPRCCCGSPGRSYCDYSDHAYTVHTWTLRMHDMAWVMDGTVDATQIWSLDGYKGLPRVELDYPVVSMDEPHVICFMVCEKYHVEDGAKTVFVIMVDMRSMKLRSVFRYPNGREYLGQQQLLPSRVSEYINSTTSSARMLVGSSQAETVPNIASESHVDEIKLQTNNVADLSHPTCESSNAPMKASSLAKILAAGLDRDDMLKAYRTLQISYGSPNGFEEGRIVS